MARAPYKTDVLILGAGAAGLFCGGLTAQAGLSTLVIDHAAKPAEKVRISGGGRCNFTNLHTEPGCFLSDNPHFAKSALARYTQHDFLELLSRHAITWHEKTLGQLFCDGRSQAIIDMLLTELQEPGGDLWLDTTVGHVTPLAPGFRVETSRGPLEAARLVIATGGLSIPKMGATGFAYDLARRLGHRVVTPRPALVPFTLSGQDKDDFASISGVATPVRAASCGTSFQEAMLFTHRGLSGPAMLQVSSYWREGAPVTIDLLAHTDGLETLKALKADHSGKTLSTCMETLLPRRLVDLLAARGTLPGSARMADLSHAALETLHEALSRFTVKPAGTEGWRTAEVTAGGIDTCDLSSKTMESRLVPGLHFIGECVDVTGWLGGYNFQWAWSSAWAAAEGMPGS